MQAQLSLFQLSSLIFQKIKYNRIKQHNQHCLHKKGRSFAELNLGIYDPEVAISDRYRSAEAEQERKN